MRGVLGLGLTIRYIGGRLGDVISFAINLLFATSTRNSPRTGYTDGLLVTYLANTPSFNEGDLQNYGAGTNPCADSRVFDGVGWSGPATVSKDAVGVDGVASAATTLTDSNAGAIDSAINAVVCPNDSNINISSCFIAKDNDETRFSGIIARLSGGTGILGKVQINTKTGAIVEVGTSLTDCGVEDHGNFWRLWGSVTNNSTGNITFQTYLIPADGTVFGTSSAAAMGSAVFDQVDVRFNQSYIDAAIITTGTALTHNADATTVPTPSFVNQDGDWAFKFRGTPKQTAQALKALFSFDSDATNYTEIQLNSANITANSVLGGVSNGAAVGLYSHTVNVQFETNAYYVAATKTLGIRSDDVSGDISAVAFVEDVLTSHPVITTTLATGNRNGSNQAICDFDNDGVPVFYRTKEDAGW